MDNSLKIGKYIRYILQNKEDVMKLLPVNRIFALYAPENTPYPFIVFSRNNLSVTYTKDVYGASVGHINEVQITVDCHGNTYEESVEVANAVRYALENTGYRDEDIYIDRMKLFSSAELTDGEGDFIQILVFTTTIQ